MRSYLKSVRKQRGYTQGDVAKQLGISTNYYCDIENSVRQKTLKSDILTKLSQVLCIPVGDILKEEKKILEEEKKDE